MANDTFSLGIVGGQEVASLVGHEVLHAERLPDRKTPHGDTSPFYKLTYGDQSCALLLRSGTMDEPRGPAGINYLANYYALKAMGCESVLSVEGVSALNPKYVLASHVIFDDVIDLTGSRRASFLDRYHAVSLRRGHLFSEQLRQVLKEELSSEKERFFDRGVFTGIQGPHLPSAAETRRLANSLGGDLVGLSISIEANLALELGIRFGGLGIVATHMEGMVHRGALLETGDDDLLTVAEEAKVARALELLPGLFNDLMVRSKDFTDHPPYQFSLRSYQDRGWLPKDWREWAKP